MGAIADPPSSPHSSLLVAGCGSADDPSADDPVLTNGALVTYTRTGGVGGIDERLRIDPDGGATIMHRRAD